MPQIKYLNKDFIKARKGLIEFIKTYYPNTYSDFNPASPGMMFVDIAAYISDVLSYYIDDTFNETLLNSAQRRENVLKISQAFGYKPKTTTTATTDLDVFMEIPSISSGSNYQPDWRYALNIEGGMIVRSTADSNITFRVDDNIIFNNSSSYEEKPDVYVYKYDDNGHPSSYLLKKTVPAISATIETVSFVMPDNPKKFHKILLSDNDIVDIIQVTDAAGNEWHEVPFLAQDTVFVSERNTIDKDFQNYNDVSYLLRLKKVNKRFSVTINEDNQWILNFGAGVSAEGDDEEITLNANNIGSSLPGGRTNIDNVIDPSNFLYTKTYGDVPYDTTLTIQYLRGGGIKSNIPANDLQTIVNISFDDNINNNLSMSLINDVKDSVTVNNSKAAIGGKGAESIEDIRQNALAYYASQQRAVTKEDYIARAYAMPSKYGSIAKAYITQDMQINRKTEDKIQNPLALDLFILAYDNDQHLTSCNKAIKQNLKTYLNEYRMLTDAINILDAYIINIGIQFEIVTSRGFNKNEILLKCIDTINKYFQIDKWQINQPIIIADIINLLYTVKGVQNVSNLQIINKWNSEEGYSGNIYNIEEATRDGIIYPSMDPSCFELKYKNDIRGRAR